LGGIADLEEAGAAIENWMRGAMSALVAGGLCAAIAVDWELGLPMGGGLDILDRETAAASKMETEPGLECDQQPEKLLGVDKQAAGGDGSWRP
jgi:hypothetical protein